MGSKYPVLKPDEIIKALNEFGFRVVSQKGSHIKLRRDGLIVKTVIVPNHYEVARGTLQSILEQAGITLEEFLTKL
ncbi:type II toxin-antitoxin system HicA family toxin [Dehalobacter sp. DCM]|uniref:type II toxin-antitoxin system HicA family toxin n=1 Tax=Dehalobacter sp. DCM TaxID=2907827 RepID=UPI0030814F2F|nr:type II toxin-antitoxin system HicA family toxin [Dehalobacter sp. DCM]